MESLRSSPSTKVSRSNCRTVIFATDGGAGTPAATLQSPKIIRVQTKREENEHKLNDITIEQIPHYTKSNQNKKIIFNITQKQYAGAIYPIVTLTEYINSKAVATGFSFQICYIQQDVPVTGGLVIKILSCISLNRHICSGKP